jgi:hypothetical protein
VVRNGRKVFGWPLCKSSLAAHLFIVLDRVKNFLPVIAKANEELKVQIEKDGLDAVRIDQSLVDHQSVSSQE